MSEPTPEETQGEPAVEPTPAPKPAGDVPPEVKRALREANKEAETLRLRLKEFEDRDKTESQKLTERAEAAESRIPDLESQVARLQVALDKGLTAAQAKRLVGTTREELEADADELLATFKPAEPPRASLDLGPRNAPRQVDDSPRGLIVAGLEASTKR
jgi:hypothetical protein